MITHSVLIDQYNRAGISVILFLCCLCILACGYGMLVLWYRKIKGTYQQISSLMFTFIFVLVFSICIIMATDTIGVTYCHAEFLNREEYPDSKVRLESYDNIGFLEDGTCIIHVGD